MNDYTKPFCTIGSKGKFWHGYMDSCYLPALESPQEEPYYPSAPPEHTLNKRLLLVESQCNYLSSKVIELRAKKYGKKDRI